MATVPSLPDRSVVEAAALLGVSIDATEDQIRAGAARSSVGVTNPSRHQAACIWAAYERAVTAGLTERLQALGNDVGAQMMDVTNSEHMTQVLMKDHYPWPFVTCIEPARLNERISIQQGAFLLPLRLERSLYDSLLATLKMKAGSFETIVIEPKDETDLDHVRKSGLVKVEFPGSVRAAALKELYLMNLSAATLYPGLEGFAKSLRTRLSIGEF